MCFLNSCKRLWRSVTSYNDLDKFAEPYHVRWHRERQEEVLQNRPDPLLPSPRLNISEVSIITRGAQKPTQSSPFLKLPFDIRRLIYKLALGGNTFHLLYRGRRIVHLRCHFHDHGIDCREFYGTTGGSCINSTYRREYLRNSQSEFDTTGLNILLTCRQIYKEAVGVLYSCNIFDMDNLHVLIYLANYRLLPQRLHTVRHLQLRWQYYSNREASTGYTIEPYDQGTWEQFWEIIGTRMALRTLKVQLRNGGPERNLNINAAWFMPMLKVGGIPDVKVTVLESGQPYLNTPAESLSQQLSEVMMRPR